MEHLDNPEVKPCTHCGELHDVDDFIWHDETSNEYYCRDCFYDIEQIRDRIDQIEGS